MASVAVLLEGKLLTLVSLAINSTEFASRPEAVIIERMLVMRVLSVL